jgi:SAM-dependent methyltransferase
MNELRYEFGKNWAEFVERKLNNQVVEESMDHMRRFMKRDRLDGLTFTDIGCGSGIHSLAALRLGARRIIAFDYDNDSVATSRKVREWAGVDDSIWSIAQGSVLDTAYMRSLPVSDVVYSWGVLHHTGRMWEAVRNAAIPLAPDGEFYIALYSSDNYLDPTPEFWIRLKRAYNIASPLTRKLIEMKFIYWTKIRPELEAGRPPMGQLESYGKRGMTAVTDAKDWLGGYPMEFAGYNETRDFCAGDLGLELVNSLTGEGCTEYMFVRKASQTRWKAIEGSRIRTPLPAPFEGVGGHAFFAPLPAELMSRADSQAEHMASRLMLFEDGTPLGLAHTGHETIRRYGSGRFSHWGNGVVFSTSDNSNPNANRRQYTYCVDY